VNLIKTIINFILGLFRSKPAEQGQLENQAGALKEDLKEIDKKLEDIDAGKMSDKDIEDYFNK
jgi:hypothetical protein